MFSGSSPTPVGSCTMPSVAGVLSVAVVPSGVWCGLELSPPVVLSKFGLWILFAIVPAVYPSVNPLNAHLT